MATDAEETATAALSLCDRNQGYIPVRCLFVFAADAVAAPASGDASASPWAAARDAAVAAFADTVAADFPCLLGRLRRDAPEAIHAIPVTLAARRARALSLVAAVERAVTVRGPGEDGAAADGEAAIAAVTAAFRRGDTAAALGALAPVTDDGSAAAAAGESGGLTEWDVQPPVSDEAAVCRAQVTWLRPASPAAAAGAGPGAGDAAGFRGWVTVALWASHRAVDGYSCGLFARAWAARCRERLVGAAGAVDGGAAAALPPWRCPTHDRPSLTADATASQRVAPGGRTPLEAVPAAAQVPGDNGGVAQWRFRFHAGRIDALRRAWTADAASIGGSAGGAADGGDGAAAAGPAAFSRNTVVCANVWQRVAAATVAAAAAEAAVSAGGSGVDLAAEKAAAAAAAAAAEAASLAAPEVFIAPINLRGGRHPVATPRFFGNALTGAVVRFPSRATLLAAPPAAVAARIHAAIAASAAAADATMTSCLGELTAVAPGAAVCALSNCVALPPCPFFGPPPTLATSQQLPPTAGVGIQLPPAGAAAADAGDNDAAGPAAMDIPFAHRPAVLARLASDAAFLGRLIGKTVA